VRIIRSCATVDVTAVRSETIPGRVRRLNLGNRNSAVVGLELRYSAKKNPGPILVELNERLAGVIIENLPYGEFIGRYDAPATLFYLDPPYFGGEGDYGAGMFSRADFGRLSEILASIAGFPALDQRHARDARGLRPLRPPGGRAHLQDQGGRDARARAYRVDARFA
jgi:hypothetical protein